MRGYIVEFVPLVGPEFPGPLWAHSWMEKRFTEDDDVVEVNDAEFARLLALAEADDDEDD